MFILYFIDLFPIEKRLLNFKKTQIAQHLHISMLSFRTKGYNGYGVQYSPFFDNKLAVATAANYGLVGNGRLFILDIEPNGQITSPISWETQDGLFDLAWSEIHENQCVVASGDGLIKLFDRMVPQFPIMQWNEHQREVFSVNWNLVDKTNFVTSSWDGSIKVWSSQRKESMLTLNPSGTDFTTMTAPVASTAQPPLLHQQQHQRSQQTGTKTVFIQPNSHLIPHQCLCHVQVHHKCKYGIFELRIHCNCISFRMMV